MEYTLYYLLLLFGVCKTQVRTDLYVDETMVSLEKEYQRCRLATPVISYTTSGPAVTLPHELNIQHGEELWVGYVKTLRVFEYIGCVWQGYLQRSFSIQADPGECFSACQTTYIGIYNNYCYCSSVAVLNLKRDYAECDIDCYNARGTTCGGETILYSFASVYKIVNDDTRLIDDRKMCGTFIFNHGVYSWKTCDTLLHGLCQTGALPITTYKTQWRWTWNPYTRACFEWEYFPATANISTLNLNSNVNEIWIGRTKGQIIYPKTHFTSDGYQGFVTNTGSSFQLEFIKDHKARKRLCVNETISQNDTTAVEPTTTYTTSPSTYASTSNGVTASPASTIMHTTEDTGGTSDSQTYRDDTNREGRKSIQVAVYVGVPTAVLVIVTVVVLFVIRWRRNKRQQTVGKPPDTEDAGGDQRPKASGRAETNNAYDEDFVAQPTQSDSQDHEYFILESREEYSTVHASGQMDNADGDYDTTNALCKRNRDVPLEGNVYNTFEETVDDTYDHTGHVQGKTTKCRIPTGTPYGIEDTYNHVMQDDGYGTTADTCTRDDDTYNHAHYGGLK